MQIPAKAITPALASCLCVPVVLAQDVNSPPPRTTTAFGLVATGRECLSNDTFGVPIIRNTGWEMRFGWDPAAEPTYVSPGATGSLYVYEDAILGYELKIAGVVPFAPSRAVIEGFDRPPVWGSDDISIRLTYEIPTLGPLPSPVLEATLLITDPSGTLLDGPGLPDTLVLTDNLEAAWYLRMVRDTPDGLQILADSAGTVADIQTQRPAPGPVGLAVEQVRTMPIDGGRRVRAVMTGAVRTGDLVGPVRVELWASADGVLSRETDRLLASVLRVPGPDGRFDLGESFEPRSADPDEGRPMERYVIAAVAPTEGQPEADPRDNSGAARIAGRTDPDVTLDGRLNIFDILAFFAAFEQATAGPD